MLLISELNADFIKELTDVQDGLQATSRNLQILKARVDMLGWFPIKADAIDTSVREFGVISDDFHSQTKKTMNKFYTNISNSNSSLTDVDTGYSAKMDAARSGIDKYNGLKKTYESYLTSKVELYMGIATVPTISTMVRGSDALNKIITTGNAN